jgi:hypothetical protein
MSIDNESVVGDVPRHESIHARNFGKPYLDNTKYKMRTKWEEPTWEGESLQNLKERVRLARYYGDVVEQEPRVLNTLASMERQGYDINNLTDTQIYDFLYNRPIDMHGSDTQSLIDNYVMEDIPKALRNFKNVAIPIIATGIGYKVNKMHPNEQRPKQRNGGSIHIAPSKRGTFTAAAIKHGMGVQEFASRVLRNKEDYSPAMVKKANFAKNASKWH